jgi:hypothetical protein
MKNVILLTIILTFAISCVKVEESKKLYSYLESFGVDLKNYKVVCFVPVDGCGSCIDPSINYSKNASNDFLLVLSSYHTKSIDFIIETKKLNKSKIVCDSKNLAEINQLVSFPSPFFYFVKKGRIFKTFDLSKTPDKVSVLKEVDKYLSKIF